MGVLKVLGLSQDEETVYDALALLRVATSGELSESTGIALRATRSALTGLTKVGLVVEHAGDHATYSVSPMEPAIDALIYAQQEALARARAHAHQLAAQTMRLTERQRPQELVAIIVGTDDIETHFVQLQRGATKTVKTFDRPPYLRTGGTGSNPTSGDRIRAGIDYQTVYDRGLLENPEVVGRIQRELAAGENGRVSANLPLKLVIADHSHALLPLLDATHPDEQAALLIRPSVLLDSLVALFGQIWDRAAPLRSTADGLQPSDDQAESRQLMALLASGMKDESIARYLGLNERTVRRKIATALTHLNAETRFQAGIRAHERGWV